MQIFVIGCPLILIAFYRKSLNALYAAGLLVPLVAFDMIVLSVFPNFTFYNSGHLNFGGKLLEILWPLTIVFVFKFIDPKAIGLKLPSNKAQLLYGIAVGSLMAILFFTIEKVWLVELLPRNAINIEILIFEFLMPSLSEELVYRGIFLSILNHYLGYSWKIFNIQFGWGLILVSLLFVMAHDVVWTGNILAIIELLTMAIVYGLFREKTDSIWPGALCHSFANGVYYLLSI